MGEFGTGSFLARPRRKTFHVVFVGRKDGDGHLFWDCSFPLFNMYAICLSLLSSCPWIVVSGLGACSGMVGCLVSMVCLVTSPGLCLLVSWLLFILKAVLVRIHVPGLPLSTGMRMTLPWRYLSILIFWTDGSRGFFLYWGLRGCWCWCLSPCSELLLSLVWGC